MGSGISTKYEKTYFYRLKEKDGDSIVSEKGNRYECSDTHTVEFYKEEAVMKFCEGMIKRTVYEESSYSRNLLNVSQHFEMNKQGYFGRTGEGKKVRVIETDKPMDSAMHFYSEISEGGATSYTDNHHGIVSQLGDGIDVYFRPYPKTLGSPAVEIKVCFGELIQKIHFIQR